MKKSCAATDIPFFSGPVGSVCLGGEAAAMLLEETLLGGYSSKFSARGFSMFPFIRDGDVITVSPLHGLSPGIGDVVVFRDPSAGRLLVHRAVGRRGGFYIMRGDNAEAADGCVPARSIIGRVTGVEREGKGVSLGLGPERFLIALLSRAGLLSYPRRAAGRVLRYLRQG